MAKHRTYSMDFKRQVALHSSVARRCTGSASGATSHAT